MSANSESTYRVLVAFDFSELAERAVQEGLRIAAAMPLSEVHVLAVGATQGDLLKLPGHDPLSHADSSERVRLAVAKIADEYEQLHGALPLHHIAVYASEGHPSEQIVSLAEELDADLVVMGTHSRTGFSRILLGSVAEAVTRRAPCGVFVVRPRDFFKGQRLPDIQPPLKSGESGLRHFKSRPLYHYVGRLQQEPERVVPVA